MKPHIVRSDLHISQNADGLRQAVAELDEPDPEVDDEAAKRIIASVLRAPKKGERSDP